MPDVDQSTGASGQPPAPQGPENRDWVERLADRSTGLQAPPSGADAPKSTGEKSLLSLAGLGLQFAGTFVVFLLMGRWIDAKMGWSFAATLTAVALALIGSMYLLIKESSGKK